MERFGLTHGKTAALFLFNIERLILKLFQLQYYVQSCLLSSIYIETLGRMSICYLTTFTLQITYNKYKTLIMGERNNITGNEQGL